MITSVLIDEKQGKNGLKKKVIRRQLANPHFAYEVYA